MLSVVLAHFVNGNNIGMIEPPRSLGFGVESPHFEGRGQLPGQNQFQRDRPVESQLFRPINHAHSAAAQFAFDFVISKALWSGARSEDRLGGLRRGGGRACQRQISHDVRQGG